MASGQSLPPVLFGSSVELHPLAPEHVTELVHIRRTPEVRARWFDVDQDLAAGWPFDDPETVCFAVMVEGRVAGMIQYDEENEPHYRHASIDIFLDPAVHGRGHGRDAVRTLARHLIRERGHDRIIIDPAADNAAAIRAYAAVGFQPVGVMREYERDADGQGWHDGLLMDLLAKDFETAD